MTTNEKSADPPNTRFLILLAVAVAVTVGGGMVYGRLVQRWGIPEDLVAFGEQLQAMPVRFGDWQMEEDLPLDDEVVEMLSCVGHINRVYRNQNSGALVSVAIVLGPPGTISVHTPEICYSSTSYPTSTPRQLKELVGADGRQTFWQLDFQPNNQAAADLRVYYAWNAGGSWIASEGPRYEFVGQKMLYKIQMATSMAPFDESEGADPCEELLQEILESGWSITG